MSDIVQLLPENIANQIAAGEVIQRPASAVKELLENAIDAGASEIKLYVNDAGKALIQVIDNGMGMSETDARMCFERHATSKIKSINDLFHIKTMGFRGEALASIAGVSQVELKTKKEGDTTGTYIEIENSYVKLQQPIAVSTGTSIAMKNLFFNVPARRNFLKSNASELRHIIDEFTRVSMSYPHIFFSVASNGQEIFHLEKGSLKQRIIQLLGNTYASKLVHVEEDTDYMNIYGFVGKPETAKRTRGDQYFFVNNRFIKSAYLNHAVVNAFSDMIPKDSFPMYALFIDIDPSRVDINVHPTKQEIKFEDEKIIYAFVQSAVKHALAQFSISPTLDFDLDISIQQSQAVSMPFTEKNRSSASSSSLFKTFSQKHQAHFIEGKSELRHWNATGTEIESPVINRDASSFENRSIGNHVNSRATEVKPGDALIQIQNVYILGENTGGFIAIHQQNAHERILYEKFHRAIQNKPIASQRSLFPTVLELAPADAALLNELIGDLKFLGFLVESFGNNSFVIQGTPADILQDNEKTAIEKMLDQYKHFSNDLKFTSREKLLRSMASQQSIRPGTSLTEKEMHLLVNDLFDCETPNCTPNGKATFLEFKRLELDKMFGK